MDPDTHVTVPLSYALDRLDRRYGQAPGAHRSWSADDLIRALTFQSIEAQVTVKSG